MNLWHGVRQARMVVEITTDNTRLNMRQCDMIVRLECRDEAPFG